LLSLAGVVCGSNAVRACACACACGRCKCQYATQYAAGKAVEVQVQLPIVSIPSPIVIGVLELKHQVLLTSVHCPWWLSVRREAMRVCVCVRV
jgi:hypothetical protein